MFTIKVLAKAVDCSCPRCGRFVRAYRPSRAYALLALATWVFTLACAPLFSIFPLSLALLPLLFGIAVPLVRFTSEKLGEPFRCPECACAIAHPRSVVEARAADAPSAVSWPQKELL